MTDRKLKSSKFFIKKYIIELNIKQEPNGTWDLNLFLNTKKITHPETEPRKRIKAKANGPNNAPNAPNNIKSPPPIPSILYITLNIKFTIHNEKYPTKKPYRENKKGEKLNNKEISLTKMLKNELLMNPETTKSRFNEKGK